VVSYFHTEDDIPYLIYSGVILIVECSDSCSTQKIQPQVASTPYLSDTFGLYRMTSLSGLPIVYVGKFLPFFFFFFFSHYHICPECLSPHRCLCFRPNFSYETMWNPMHNSSVEFLPQPFNTHHFHLHRFLQRRSQLSNSGNWRNISQSSLFPGVKKDRENGEAISVKGTFLRCTVADPSQSRTNSAVGND